MKVIVFVVAFGMACCAQWGTAQTASCGPAQQTFQVTVNKGEHPARVEPGKAAIYVFQDDTQFQYLPRPTTRIGVDGKWMGATHANSYLYSVVDPGEHHVCVQWQGIGMRGKQALLHFDAAPGNSYYFRIVDTWIRDVGRKQLELSQVDSDEGQLLTSKAVLASSEPKR